MKSSVGDVKTIAETLGINASIDELQKVLGGEDASEKTEALESLSNIALWLTVHSDNWQADNQPVKWENVTLN
jgi:hypothetical protein